MFLITRQNFVAIRKSKQNRLQNENLAFISGCLLPTDPSFVEVSDV